MLIRRDGFTASPYPQANDFEKLLSARILANPQFGVAMKHHDALKRRVYEQRKFELLSKTEEGQL
jgi:hypothetical protein